MCPLPPLPIHLQQRLDTGKEPAPSSTMTIATPVEELATAVHTLETMQTLLRGPSSPDDSTTLTNAPTTTTLYDSSLPTLVEKFQKRSQEVDPITLQPRYGSQTMGRVQWVMETYDFLQRQILGDNDNDVNDDDNGGDSNDAKNNNGTTNTPTAMTNSASIMLQQWQDQYQQQVQREHEEQIRQEAERVRREEELRLQRLRQQQEEQAALQAERDREQQRLEQERAHLRTQAEQARQRRLAQERAEHEWFEGIVKGVEGVRQQLVVLQASTKAQDDSSRAYKTAVQSLYTLFQQINAHPEETKFRRIRRDHDQFQADIGRYKGGVELLIAAGFTLGAIDDVPCYISKEPDIEKDMDGWAAWFDVLRGTLQVLEDERMKTL